MPSQWRLRRALHEIAKQGRFCHDIGARYAIETCNPLRLCGASAANHEVGARNAIESFLTKQALEVLRGPLVTILARYMRLKIDIFQHHYRARNWTFDENHFWSLPKVPFETDLLVKTV